jgi:predicted Holliday junction resolvase-like endonuclease
MLEEIVIGILIIILIGITIIYVRLLLRVEERARKIHETWKEQDLTDMHSRLQTQTTHTIKREVDLQSREWKGKEEERIRQDAIRRSQEVIHGKVTEHLIPFFPSFPWNPSDARFLGSPIDFVVFDGLSEGNLKEIVLVEVKSGNSKSLTSRERAVRQCVTRGDITFQIIHPKD